jgi:hypothetical protein
MKVVHLQKEKTSDQDLANEAKELEAVIAENPLHTKALDRLMVVYRKLKEPAKELKVINTAIKEFEEKFNERQPAFNKKIETLSRALRKATGLADKKGNNLFQPGELTRWKRRKALLEKRRKKAK